MYIEFDIFQEALPNLLEFLGLNFSGAKNKQTNKQKLPWKLLVRRTHRKKLIMKIPHANNYVIC